MRASRLCLPALLVAWLSLAPDVRVAGGYAGEPVNRAQPPSAQQGALVLPIPVDDLLAAVREGRSIVFVDAREAPEYREEHIPGAINVPLRAVPSAALFAYAQADLVIPYCLKDFRGFEVARALREQGVQNVRLLSRPGINGWKTLGLPTAGEVPGRSDDEAQAQLIRCAQTRECLKAR